jgi:hypothetical protein
MAYKLPVLYSHADAKQRREVREQYVQQQNGLCYWCNCSLDFGPPKEITNKKINWRLFPPNFLRYPVHLQHNHDTDLTEGAVHAYCNAVMWQYHGR